MAIVARPSSGAPEAPLSAPGTCAATASWLLPGDGVGPEIIDAAKRVLDAAGETFGYLLAYEVGIMGGCAIDQFGASIEDGLIERCRATDAVLLGAVGPPRWTPPTRTSRVPSRLWTSQGPRLFRQICARSRAQGAGAEQHAQA